MINLVRMLVNLLKDERSALRVHRVVLHYLVKHQSWCLELGKSIELKREIDTAWFSFALSAFDCLERPIK